MAEILDARVNAYRGDLADRRLEGKVDSRQFVIGRNAAVSAPVATLRRGPGFEHPQDAEMLFGDEVWIFDEADGWCWVQNARDDYVGYCLADDLSSAMEEPTHILSACSSLVFPEPDIKTHPLRTLPMMARVTVTEQSGKFSRLAGGGWLYKRHLEVLDAVEADYVATACQFLETPYLWGGNSYLGLDCSGLVQIAFLRAGYRVPRDADQQEAFIGHDIGFEGDLSIFRAGDLIFWRGHVGIMVDPENMIHANATDMKTSLGAIGWIENHIREIEGQPISSVRRLSADQ